MYRRILVGTDGSATAARAVERAVALAAATRAPLTIACAGAYAEAAAIVQAAAAAHAAVAIEIDTAVLDGEAASALVDYAEREKVDLLVVGNKGMTGAARFLLGSVPNRITHHAPCAVLIVRTT